MVSRETAMDLNAAFASVHAYMDIRARRDNLHRGAVTGGHRKIGRSLEEFRMKMEKVDYEPIYDHEAYKKCLQVVALHYLGFTPREIDNKYGWSFGTTAALHEEHPKLLKRAEQMHIEASYIRFHQAKVRELDILSHAIEPAVIYLMQVVRGGGPESIDDQYRSRLLRSVETSEVTPNARLKAAELLLKFTQDRFKMLASDPENPKPGMIDIPEEFRERVQKAQEAATNVVPLKGAS